MIPTPCFTEEKLTCTVQKDVFSKLFSDAVILSFRNPGQNEEAFPSSDPAFL